VQSAGVITTPGVAYLARSQHFDAGVVISASHNPWTDNGIKVFSGTATNFPMRTNLPSKRKSLPCCRARKRGRSRIPFLLSQAFPATPAFARSMFAGWLRTSQPI